MYMYYIYAFICSMYMCIFIFIIQIVIKIIYQNNIQNINSKIELYSSTIFNSLEVFEIHL